MIRQNEGVYIHLSKWAPYEAEFIIPNGKRAQAIKMQQVWALEPTVYKKWVCVPNPHYIPEKLKCFKIVWEWAKIPTGLVGLQPSKFIPTYDNKVIEHPALKRESYDYQEYNIQAVLSGSLPRSSDGKDPKEWTPYTIHLASWSTFKWVYDWTTLPQQKFDINYNVWLLHVSTWAGKTQTICSLINRLKRNSLVVCDNLSRLTQMVKDIEEILWVTPIQILGKELTKFSQYWERDGRKEIEEQCKLHWIRVSKAITKKYWPADTIESLKKKLSDAWFPFQEPVSKLYPHITICSIDSCDKVNPHDYGLILLDEADTYLGSDDRREWVGNLSPEYMYALTGTVKINHVDDSVFRLYYGPTTRLEMLHLIPTYVQVLSNFTYILENVKDFHEMKAALYSDEKRNKLIVDTVVTKGKGRKWLVFTEHVEHARWLAEELYNRGIKVFLLIGEIWKEERERIRQEVKSHDGDVCIVWSVKIIGRGFDLPEISFAVLTTCEKFTSNIEQYLGRIIRKFDGKPAPIFYDITDHMQYLLHNQSRKRIATFRWTFPTGKTIIL